MLYVPDNHAADAPQRPTLPPNRLIPDVGGSPINPTPLFWVILVGMALIWATQ